MVVSANRLCVTPGRDLPYLNLKSLKVIEMAGLVGLPSPYPHERYLQGSCNKKLHLLCSLRLFFPPKSWSSCVAFYMNLITDFWTEGKDNVTTGKFTLYAEFSKNGILRQGPPCEFVKISNSKSPTLEWQWPQESGNLNSVEHGFPITLL